MWYGSNHPSWFEQANNYWEYFVAQTNHYVFNILCLRLLVPVARPDSSHWEINFIHFPLSGFPVVVATWLQKITIDDVLAARFHWKTRSIEGQVPTNAA